MNEGLCFLCDVCSRFPQARFMYYNNGLCSKTKLCFNVYKCISSEIPNLAAVKNPTKDMNELHELFSEELPLAIYVMEHGYGYASMFSECGLLISLLNLDYDHAWKYFNAGKSRNINEIIEYHNEFSMIYKELFTNIKPGMIDSAYDKSFVKSHIPDFSLRLLPPYIGPKDDQYESFIKIIKEKLPHWKIGV